MSKLPECWQVWSVAIKFSSKLNHSAIRDKLLLNLAKAALKKLEQIKLPHAEFEKSAIAA